MMMTTKTQPTTLTELASEPEGGAGPGIGTLIAAAAPDPAPGSVPPGNHAHWAGWGHSVLRDE